MVVFLGFYVWAAMVPEAQSIQLSGSISEDERKDARSLCFCFKENCRDVVGGT